MAKGRSPSGDSKNQLDIFDWFASAKALLGRWEEDVASVSRLVTPASFFGLMGFWIGADNPATRQVLGIATAFALPLVCVWMATYACRSRISRKDISIALHGGAAAGSMLVVAVVIGCVWRVDLEAAEKMRIEELKREEDQRAKRALEEQCQKDRNEAIERAKRAQRIAAKALDDCKADFAKKFMPFTTLEAHCKPAQDSLDSAQKQLGSARARLCTTGAVKKGQDF